MMIPRGVEMDSRRAKLRLAIGATLFVLLLGGCGPEPKAPEPTANPHPHEFTKLKITVEPGSGVTGVKVESLWNVGNIGCAPHQGWPSGASITKQVNTPEKVDKTGPDEWIATVVDDRFLPDKCQWHGGGYGIRFMHGYDAPSSMATGKDDIEQAGVLKLTCEAQVIVPPAPPVCTERDIFVRDMEQRFKANHYKVFNATVEIVQ